VSAAEEAPARVGNGRMMIFKAGRAGS
jgi:hypothetical protein